VANNGSRSPGDALLRGTAGGASTPNSNTALEVLKSLPPEAIVKVVDIVGDVVRARVTFAQKHADFLHEIDLMRQTAGNRERVLSMVSTLLLSAEINDDAKMKLVDTICQLALR
jgi:hypothetical protein